MKTDAICTAVMLSVLGGGCLQAQAQHKGQHPLQPAAVLPFFAGVHQVRSSYEVFFPSTPGAAGVAGWQATTGMQVRPRLEMQLGFSYTREINNQDPAYQSTSLAGQYLDGSRYNKRQTYSIPVVARYAVARFSRPRLYADAILGLTLLGSEYRFTEERRVDHQVVSGFEDSGRATQLYATAGLGVRCPFGRHFEGVLDWTYSRNFRTVPESVHLVVTGNKYGLTRALSVGLRYRFNLKKPAAAAAP